MQRIPQVVRDFGAIALGSYIGNQALKMAPIRRNRNKGYRYRPVVRKSTSQGMRRMPVARRPLDKPVTQQRDYSTPYVKKRMPRYKRKQWVSFTKKVFACSLKNAGLKTVLFNSRLTSITNAGYQAYFAIALYGNKGNDDNGTTQIGYNDLNRIFRNDPQIAHSTGTPSLPLNGQLNFASAVLDVTLRNLGELDSEVDVYFCYHWKDTENTNPAGANTADLYKDLKDGGYNQEIAVGNGLVTLEARGATPFDVGYALSATGLKIMKKQKFLMPPGRSVFLQHRIPRNFQFEWNNLNKKGYGLRRLTYEVLVVHKPSVTNNDSAISTIACGVTRKYSYTLTNWNQDENALNP